MKRLGGAGLVFLISCLSGCVTPFGISEDKKREVLSQLSSMNLKEYSAMIEGFGAMGVMKELEPSFRYHGVIGCATAGNAEAQFELIEEVYLRWPNALFDIDAHSMGAGPAEELARLCNRRGIKIKNMRLYGPFQQIRVPAGVENFIEFRSDDGYAFQGPAYTRGNLESQETSFSVRELHSTHMSLPGDAMGNVFSSRTRQRRIHQKTCPRA